MKLKAIPNKKHKLDQKKIDTSALYVLETLIEQGHIAYLVGGGVRDLLLDQKPKDFDIATTAKPQEIKAIFKNCYLIGRRFRLAHIHFGRKIIEVSTFRAGDLESEELIVRDNIWGTPKEDAMRRDFTINGLFYDVQNDEVLDFVGGFSDVEKKCLKTIGPAQTRFKQDPVRMIRLLKFVARFGFSIDEKTLTALEKCKDHIIHSSNARVLEELLRMIESSSALTFFELLTEHGILQLLFPMIADTLENEHKEYSTKLLQVKDTLIDERQKFSRKALFATLIYGTYHVHLKNRFETPSLGQMQTFTQQFLQQLPSEIMHLPKKIKASLHFILMMQNRFTPPTHLPKTFRKKLLAHSDFKAALEFLSIRAHLEPEAKKAHVYFSKLPIPKPRRNGRTRKNAKAV